jgi:hypothetical protein
MKNEIEQEFFVKVCEVIENELFGGFLEMDGYDRCRVRETVKKIVPLFSNLLDSCEDEINKELTGNWDNTRATAKDILKLIKDKLEANNE